MSLKILIDMILKGSSVNKETAANTPDIVPKQASLTIAQLLMFNSISRAHDRKEPSNTHHTREKKCPLPIYAALKIHGAARERSLFDAFFKLGMCISYDRVLSISTDIANSVIAWYGREAVVCPSTVVSCVKDCLLQQQWTTLTTILVRPPPKTHSSELLSLLFKIQHPK